MRAASREALARAQRACDRPQSVANSARPVSGRGAPSHSSSPKSARPNPSASVRARERRTGRGRGSNRIGGGVVPSLLELIQVLVSLSLGVALGVTLMHALDRKDAE
jgi:hypothetical protein